MKNKRGLSLFIMTFILLYIYMYILKSQIIYNSIFNISDNILFHRMN